MQADAISDAMVVFIPLVFFLALLYPCISIGTLVELKNVTTGPLFFAHISIFLIPLAQLLEGKIATAIGGSIFILWCLLLLCYYCFILISRFDELGFKGITIIASGSLGFLTVLILAFNLD